MNLKEARNFLNLNPGHDFSRVRLGRVQHVLDLYKSGAIKDNEVALDSYFETNSGQSFYPVYAVKQIFKYPRCGSTACIAGEFVYRFGKHCSLLNANYSTRDFTSVARKVLGIGLTKPVGLLFSSSQNLGISPKDEAIKRLEAFTVLVLADRKRKRNQKAKRK